MSWYEKVVGVKQDKKAFREYRARGNALPTEYRTAWQEIEWYVWHFGSMDGSLDLLNDIVTLFESAAAEGRSVLDITGSDVAGFCDGLIEEWKGRTWQGEERRKFNERFSKKLAEAQSAEAKPERSPGDQA